MATQIVICKRCFDKLDSYELRFGLCSECEDILDAQHDEISPQIACEHGNDQDDCRTCEAEGDAYVRQQINDFERGVMG